MALFSNMFPLLSSSFGSQRSNTVNIDHSLGNVLLSGSSRPGIERMIINYSVNALQSGDGLIIFRNSDLSDTASYPYPSISNSYSTIFNIDCAENASTDQIDVFAGMTDAEMDNYIMKIFDRLNPIDTNKKMLFLNYMSVMHRLLKKQGKPFRLNALVNYTIDDVENMNFRYVTDPNERQRNERFLNNIRGYVHELEAIFYNFSMNVAGEILSGSKNISQIFRSKPILEVDLNFTDKKEESTVIMTAILDSSARFSQAVSGRNGVTIIVDGVPNDVLAQSGLLRLVNGKKMFHVMYNVSDIKKLADVSNEWIDKADSYFFFRQNADENKEYCSSFFGEHEVTKQSHTQGKTQASFFDRMAGRGGTNYNTGVTTNQVRERVYPPEEFANLSENMAYYFLKAGGSGRIQIY